MKIFETYHNRLHKDYGRYLKIKGNLQLLLIEYDPIFVFSIIRDVSGNCPEYLPSEPYEIN